MLLSVHSIIRSISNLILHSICPHVCTSRGANLHNHTRSITCTASQRRFYTFYWTRALYCTSGSTIWGSSIDYLINTYTASRQGDQRSPSSLQIVGSAFPRRSRVQCPPTVAGSILFWNLLEAWYIFALSICKVPPPNIQQQQWLRIVPRRGAVEK